MCKRKKRSFRKRLLTSYLAVSFIALTIFAAFFFVHSIARMREDQFYAVKNGAHAVTNAVNNQMHSIDMMLSSIHADPIVQSYLRGDAFSTTQRDVHSAITMQDVFARRAKSVQVFSSVRTGLSQYNSLSRYNQIVFSNIQVKAQEWYKKTEEAGGKTCWYYSNEGDFDKNPCFYVSRLIYNTRKPSQKLGVIRICVGFSTMQELLDLSFYSDAHAALVVDGEPVILTTDDLGKGQALHEIIRMKGSSELLHNETFIAAAVDVNYPGWSVFVLLQRGVYMRKQLSFLISILTIWGVMFVVTYSYSGRFAAHLASPIRNLYEKMSQFGRANNIYIEEETEEEIASLYKGFNAMIAKIDTLVEQEKENEMRMLQAQINPHFVYNTLESLRAMASVREETDIAEMIGIFGMYFRECLNDGRFYSTIEHEVQHAIDYLRIQHLRYPEMFTWEIIVDNTIRECGVPHAVLQPLIENAIMHGFEEMTEGGHISIKGWQDHGKIFLSVSDNGCGADPDELTAMAHDENTQNFCCIRNVWMRLNRFSTQAEFYYEINGEGGLSALMCFEKRIL
jgi:two-component system sensor histidine kinase YesM